MPLRIRPRAVRSRDALRYGTQHDRRPPLVLRVSISSEHRRYLNPVATAVYSYSHTLPPPPPSPNAPSLDYLEEDLLVLVMRHLAPIDRCAVRQTSMQLRTAVLDLDAAFALEKAAGTLERVAQFAQFAVEKHRPSGVGLAAASPYTAWLAWCWEQGFNGILPSDSLVPVREACVHFIGHLRRQLVRGRCVVLVPSLDARFQWLRSFEEIAPELVRRTVSTLASVTLKPANVTLVCFEKMMRHSTPTTNFKCVKYLVLDAASAADPAAARRWLLERWSASARGERGLRPIDASTVLLSGPLRWAGGAEAAFCRDAAAWEEMGTLLQFATAHYGFFCAVAPVLRMFAEWALPYADEDDLERVASCLRRALMTGWVWAERGEPVLALTAPPEAEPTAVSGAAPSPAGGWLATADANDVAARVRGLGIAKAHRLVEQRDRACSRACWDGDVRSLAVAAGLGQILTLRLVVAVQAADGEPSQPCVAAVTEHP